MTKTRNQAAAPRHSAASKRGLPPILWIGLAGLLLVVAGIAFIARPGSGAATQAAPIAGAAGQPKLAVDRTKIDFGTVPLDKPVQATFKLTNTGGKPLEIDGQPTIQVQQGC